MPVRRANRHPVFLVGLRQLDQRFPTPQVPWSWTSTIPIDTTRCRPVTGPCPFPFTPICVSWQNLIAHGFRMLQRQVLIHGSFARVQSPAIAPGPLRTGAQSPRGTPRWQATTDTMLAPSAQIRMVPYRQVGGRWRSSRNARVMRH